MSAHCEKHGCDLVYTEYPFMECPMCAAEDRIAVLEEQLAQARWCQLQANEVIDAARAMKSYRKLGGPRPVWRRFAELLDAYDRLAAHYDDEHEEHAMTPDELRRLGLQKTAEYEEWNLRDFLHDQNREEDIRHWKPQDLADAAPTIPTTEKRGGVTSCAFCGGVVDVEYPEGNDD